jgi:hypothetical protein
MKTLFITLYIFFCSITIAQSYQWCVDSLYSENYGTKISAIRCVNDFEPEGATEVILELIENQQPYLQIQFLNALYTLGYEEVSTQAHNLILRADEFANDPEYPWDPLDAKVFATAILIYKGDYTTIEYVFEQLNQGDITESVALAFQMLTYIMNNVPSYKEEAKNILVGALNNDDEYFRYYALSYLAEEFGEEMNSELVDKFVNDSDLPIRTLALEHLCINNYSELNSLLKQQLEMEVEPSLRIDIADSLLIRFGEPSDLKTVIDYQPNEPDETARPLMGYSIDDFIPPKPATLNCQGMITRLVSYTTEMFTYGWITNTKTRDYYISTLNLLNSQLERRLYAEACATLNVKLLERIETDLAANKITTEGYKFLHYYCVYIKEEFPGPLPCL